MATQLSRVGVVGLGTMGAGIAEVLARNGIDVVAADVDDAAVARGRTAVQASTARAVTRGRLTEEDAAGLRARIRFVTDLAELADADLVVEAVPERLDLKRVIFSRLDEVCKPAAILATNTSSLPVTEIAVTTDRPGRVVGMHFFNPAPVMRLVEVVRTVLTEPDVVADVEHFARRLGKTAVTVGDRAGFVANALLFGYLNRAVGLYESRTATREDLDAAMKLGCGLPMGPLELLDLIGLDTAQQILETMFEQSRDPLHAPRPLLRQMITAGLLGRKAGRGFYTYGGPGNARGASDAQAPEPATVAAAAREVHRVAVLGAGPRAAAVADLFGRAGFAVLAVPAGFPELSASGPSEDLGSVDLVLDAVEAEPADRRVLFARLGALCAPGTVLATTATSPVVACAVATARPADVVGLHFTGPGGAIAVVEVVQTVLTAPDVTATAVAVSRRLGVHPVCCGDRAGFVVDALLFPYLNDAVRMLEARYADVDDIDAAMTLGCGYPSGPFALLDAVGLDVALAVERRLYEESREPGLAPAPLLTALVTAGRRGERTGRGFRTHRPDGATAAASA